MLRRGAPRPKEKGAKGDQIPCFDVRIRNLYNL